MFFLPVSLNKMTSTWWFGYVSPRMLADGQEYPKDSLTSDWLMQRIQCIGFLKSKRQRMRSDIGPDWGNNSEREATKKGGKVNQRQTGTKNMKTKKEKSLIFTRWEKKFGTFSIINHILTWTMHLSPLPMYDSAFNPPISGGTCKSGRTANIP